MIDYYEVLEVSPNVSDEMLGKAYRTLMHRYHPDQFHSSYKQFATEKTQLINEAYRVLSDPDTRRRYNAKLAEKTRIEPVTPQRLLGPVARTIGVALFVFVILGTLLGLFRLFMASPMIKLVLLAVILMVGFWAMKKQVIGPTKR